MIHAGDRIAIYAHDSFADEAEVISICHPDELPAIEGAPNIDKVRAILAEGSFVSVALIEYKFLDETLCFIAFQNTRGEWSDLHGQHITIEPRRATNEARKIFENLRRRGRPDH